MPGLQGGDITKLNVGCGHQILKGWVNCDLIPGKGVNQVFDASKRWPFDDNSIDQVYMSHILEHLEHWEDTVLEAARVLKFGGLFTIRVPYGVNMTAYHVRYFNKGTLEPFYHNTTGLPFYLPDGRQMVRPPYHLVQMKVNHAMPFAWHLNHYLGIKWFADIANGKRGLKTLPIGTRSEIIWVLQKENSLEAKA